MAIVGYIRVSTDLQSESVDLQLKSINNYAQEHNIGIREIIIDENVSGGTEYEDRLKVHQAISLLESGDIFLIHRMDRLSRDLGTACLLDRDVKRKKSRIVSISGEGTDMKDKVGASLITQLMMVFAHHEREVIVSRIKMAMANKKRRGELVGRVPYGKKLHKNGFLLEDEIKEIAIIKKMIQLRNKKLSYNKIAKYLNERERWNRNYIPWNEWSVHRIIDNNTKDSGK